MKNGYLHYLVMFISLFVKRNNFIPVTEPYNIVGFIVMCLYLFSRKTHLKKESKNLKKLHPSGS